MNTATADATFKERADTLNKTTTGISGLHSEQGTSIIVGAVVA